MTHHRSAILIIAGAMILAVPPSTATADGLSIGASLGRVDGRAVGDAARTRSVFGRARVTERLALELELARDLPDSESYRSTRLGASALVDLASRRGARLVPYVLAGVGVARSSTTFWEGEHRHHEVGAGLDYALGSGLTLGIEGRVGERALLDERQRGIGILLVYAPAVPASDEYASLRVTLTFGL